MPLYYRSPCGRVELWQGTCQQVPLPPDAVAVTDPPYNIGKTKVIGKFCDRETGQVQERLGIDFDGWDKTCLLPRYWAEYMPNTVVSFYSAKYMYRLLQAFREAEFEIVQDFHWCKPNAPPPLRAIGFAWGTESGYIFRRSGTKHLVNKKAGYSPNFFVRAVVHGPEREQHGTQKPLSVMKWLIRTFSIRDMLIVDPFMGTGTTGSAAIALQRRFLGVEPNTKYCALAKERLIRALTMNQQTFRLD